MRVDVRDPDTAERLGRVEVDPVQRPTRAPIAGTDREVFLDWDAAIDDAGRLRRCIVCGCRDLYSARIFPQVTGFVVVLAFAGAAVGIFGREGFATNPVVLGALVLVLLLDVASLIFRTYRLVCYRCRSTYSDLEIARHHQRWDRAIAEKYSRGAPGRSAGGPSRAADDEDVLAARRSGIDVLE
jgi:hypothetical protein